MITYTKTPVPHHRAAQHPGTPTQPALVSYEHPGPLKWASAAPGSATPTTSLFHEPIYHVAEHALHSTFSHDPKAMIAAFDPLGRHVTSGGQQFRAHDVEPDHRVRLVRRAMGEIDLGLAPLQFVEHRVAEECGPSAVRMTHPEILDAIGLGE